MAMADGALRFASHEHPLTTKGDRLRRGSINARLRNPEGTCLPDGCVRLADKESGPAREEEAHRLSFVTWQEFSAVERELDQIREELKRLRWKVRHIGEQVQPLVEDSKRYNGYTLTELRAMVQFERDPYKAAHTILAALFSDLRLLPQQQQPVAGQICDAETLRKARIDPELYTVYCGILQSVFPDLREKDAAGAERDSKGNPGTTGQQREASPTGPVPEIFQDQLCGVGPAQQIEGTLA